MKRRPIYYDTETTGVKPGKDRIIELAALDPVQDVRFSMLIHPECPIPAEASSISNITDEMVKDAPKIPEVLDAFLQFCSGDVLLIAHNNDAFDQLFLEAEFLRANRKMPPWKFFDSLKWARKYRNDLPRHSLQSLREVYGITANQAHRALDDVVVLYQLVSRMIDDLSWEKVVELVEQQPQVLRMPFGKHAGKMLSEVPKDYIAWLMQSGALDKKENALLKESLQKLG